MELRVTTWKGMDKEALFTIAIHWLWRNGDIQAICNF